VPLWLCRARGSRQAREDPCHIDSQLPRQDLLARAGESVHAPSDTATRGYGLRCPVRTAAVNFQQTPFCIEFPVLCLSKLKCVERRNSNFSLMKAIPLCDIIEVYINIYLRLYTTIFHNSE